MYPEALSSKYCMDFILGEPEKIHNIFLSSYASQKILSIFHPVMYPEALSTKQCMDFILGEPEKIHNIFLSSYASQKILSILLCILKLSAQNNAWTSSWVNQKRYITFSYQVMRAKKFSRFCYVS